MKKLLTIAILLLLWGTTISEVSALPPEMVLIPGGEFEMGDHFGDGGSDELPVHAVLLDSFYMSRCEITNGQYCDYLNSAEDACDIKIDGGIVYASSDDSNSFPYCDMHSHNTDSQIDYNDVSGTFSVRTKGEPPRDMSNDPMVDVSWYGAKAYCDFYGYRLPTEAEWEYAARGGLSGKRFPWADPNITHSQANYYASPGSYPYDVSPNSGYHPLWNGVNPDTSPVGFFDGTMKYKADYNWPGSDTSYQTTSGANGFGLYDMSGNVWEWCNDWYDSGYYDTSPYDNPTGPAGRSCRVLRGGGWSYFAYCCRVAFRNDHAPGSRYCDGGFRVVRNAEPVPVEVDIKPQSCPNPLNVKSQGVLQVAILGSEEFDVTTIDVASVRLAGVAPIRSSYEDVATPVSDSNDCNCITDGPDGFLDLTLKFETQAIVEALGEVNDGDVLPLILTGVLSDETPVEGTDCILVRGRHKPFNEADINKDGVVNMTDFTLMAENWLQSSIVQD